MSRRRRLRILLGQFRNSEPLRLEGRFNKESRDLIAQCLVKDPERRPKPFFCSRHQLVKMFLSAGFVVKDFTTTMIAALGRRTLEVLLTSATWP